MQDRLKRHVDHACIALSDRRGLVRGNRALKDAQMYFQIAKPLASKQLIGSGIDHVDDSDKDLSQLPIDWKYRSKLKSQLNTSEHAWKMGAFLLSKNISVDDNIVKFLMRAAELNNPENTQINLLIETTLQQIKSNAIEDGYERLSSFINIHPYNQSGILHGYAGVMCYLLWMQSLSSSGSENRYLADGIAHFVESFNLQFTASCFLDLYLKMQSSIDLEVARLKLMHLYVSHCKDDLYLNMITFQFLSSHFKEDRDVQLKCAREIIKVNACTRANLDQFQNLIFDCGQNQIEVLRMYIGYLDYCKGDFIVWKSLVGILEIINNGNTPGSGIAQFGDRSSWWPEYHFDEGERGVYKCVVAHLLVKERVGEWEWKVDWQELQLLLDKVGLN